MNLRDLTKSQRRSIRELAVLAHERELSAELGRLETAFKRWRAHELSPHELNELIHAFHHGPSRRLFAAYTGAVPVMAIGSAIARGIVAESEVPEHIRDVLAPVVSVAREQIASDDDGDPGEPP